MIKNMKGISGFTEISVYLFLIFIFPFLFIPYGLDYTDGPFHFLAYNGDRPLIGLRFFYTFGGALWSRLFGDTVLSYRIITVILLIFSHFVPAYVILRNKVQFKNILKYVALSVILTIGTFIYIFGWDIQTLFILSILFITGYKFLNNPSWKIILLLGLLSAILVAIRFPNIVVLVPVFLLIIFNKYPNQTIKKKAVLFMVYLFSFIISFFLIYLFHHKLNQIGIVGNPAIFGFMEATEKLQGDTAYSITELMGTYIRHGFRIIEMTGVVLVFVVIWKYKERFRLKQWMIIAIALMFLMIYFYLYVLTSSYHYYLSFFYSAIAFIILFYLLYKNIGEGNSNIVLFLLFALLIGFIPSAGSHPGLLKMSRAFLFMLPVLLYFLFNYLPKEDRRGAYIFLIIVAAFSVFHKTINSETYEDGRIPQLEATVNHPKLKGIKTTWQRKEQIETILNVRDSILKIEPNSDFFYYGKGIHLFRYLTNSKQHYSAHSPLNSFKLDVNSKEQIDALMDYLNQKNSKTYVFLLFGYPEEHDPMEGGEMEIKLNEKGHKLISSGDKWRLFKPGYKPI